MAEYLNQKCYPKGSENVIKEQYLIKDELYIITWDKVKWKLHLNGKKIAESKFHDSLYERIPEYR